MILTQPQLKALRAVAAEEHDAIHKRLPREEIRWLFHHRLIDEVGIHSPRYGDVHFMTLTEFGSDTLERLKDVRIVPLPELAEMYLLHLEAEWPTTVRLAVHGMGSPEKAAAMYTKNMEKVGSSYDPLNCDEGRAKLTKAIKTFIAQ